MSSDNNNNQNTENDDVIKDVTSGEYKYGFVSDIDTDVIPRGLSEEVIRLISAKKQEPEWLSFSMPTAIGLLLICRHGLISTFHR